MSVKPTACTCHCGRVVRCVAASSVRGLHNVALNKPVFASSVFLTYAPSFGNDGIRETVMGASCFHSNWQDYPWWAVDLGQMMPIYRVDFTNRGDCCGMTKSIPAFSYCCLSRAVSTDWCFKHEYWIFSLKCYRFTVSCLATASLTFRRDDITFW